MNKFVAQLILQWLRKCPVNLVVIQALLGDGNTELRGRTL